MSSIIVLTNDITNVYIIFKIPYFFQTTRNAKNINNTNVPQKRREITGQSV